MTILEIQKAVRKKAKPMTRAGLYKHIKALKLKPRGVARPAIYPEDAADRIITRLGFRLRKNGHQTKRGRAR